jgi:aminopeptidase N
MYNGVEWYQTQLDQLHSLLDTFVAISNTMNEYNLLKQQEQEILAQKQFFPIFNKKNLFYLQGHKHRNQNAHQIDKRKIQVLCVHNFLVIYIYFFYF